MAPLPFFLRICNSFINFMQPEDARGDCRHSRRVEFFYAFASATFPNGPLDTRIV